MAKYDKGIMKCIHYEGPTEIRVADEEELKYSVLGFTYHTI